MSENPVSEVTRLVRAAGDGDSKAAAELLPLVYAELRRLAQARLAKTPPGNTLQPTALVHEAYVRLIGSGDPGWDSRGHFFAAAAQAMRQILVEQARRKATVKHGGGRQRIELEDVDAILEPPREDVLALDEALQRLEALDPRKGKIVLLRYFAGLTDTEVAAALEVSTATVEREWRFARALLFTLLSNRDAK